MISEMFPLGHLKEIKQIESSIYGVKEKIFIYKKPDEKKVAPKKAIKKPDNKKIKEVKKTSKQQSKTKAKK